MDVEGCYEYMQRPLLQPATGQLEVGPTRRGEIGHVLRNYI